ncbi:rhomboid family intramembrane serine protease [bacterium]|nr:rhomboid family intramembrane serine protease [bacterium]
MTIRDRIQMQLSQGLSALQQIIVLNLAVYLITLLISIFSSLMQVNLTAGLEYFYLPSNLSHLIMRPWTIITNIFMHAGFWHILMNMLILYMIGRILQDFISNKRFWTIFLGGALAGCFLYVLSFNIFPAFSDTVGQSVLLGASGGVTAIAVATGVFLPNYEVFLYGLFRVKLKWIALVMVLLDLVALPDLVNAGGRFAHLGGAIFGALYILYMKGSINLPTANIKRSRRSKMKVVHYDERVIHRKRKAERHKPDQEEIDAILDKINQSGYDSLTRDEKETLIKASE